MTKKYDEVPTETIRYNENRMFWERYYEKITPKQIMIIDGRRCEVQRIIGGVWRREADTSRF